MWAPVVWDVKAQLYRGTRKSGLGREEGRREMVVRSEERRGKCQDIKMTDKVRSTRTENPQGIEYRLFLM
jgi:hypothetical protein